jgi:trafficking protein particle complex subunit 11
MDDYPAYSLDHSVPLLLTFGLPSSSKEDSTLEVALKEEAILIRSELPVVESEQASALSRYIREGDASGLPWNGRDDTRRYKFRLKSAGRTYLLPPRRSSLPENFEAPQSPIALHSPFSPLSPSCHLYPDGIIDPRWLQKHQDLVPSVLLSFYTLASEPTLATLNDNKVKTDINGIRNALLQSGYKTRIAVAILIEQSSPSTEGVQERLDNIRKGCGLEPKAFFSVPSHASQEELERIADNAMVTLYAQAVEYYRDLGRHARKKRGRGFAPQPTVPPTSGTSQTLTLPGWNMRYDFKSAIFAEFRQEMDAALRSFEQAYECPGYNTKLESAMERSSASGRCHRHS